MTLDRILVQCGVGNVQSRLKRLLREASMMFFSKVRSVGLKKNNPVSALKIVFSSSGGLKPVNSKRMRRKNLDSLTPSDNPEYAEVVTGKEDE